MLVVTSYYFTAFTKLLIMKGEILQYLISKK